MVTRLYFHAASNPLSNLPTTEQNTTLTAADNFDAQTVNRLMDITIGTSQAQIERTNAIGGPICFITKWVSPALEAQTINANTWTLNFAALKSVAASNFPVNGSAEALPVNVYVWRPSTTSKVGTILAGGTAGDLDEPGSSINTVLHTTFSGSSVTAEEGDVLVYEFWVDNCGTGADTKRILFDGTTVNTTNNATGVTSHASFIETPQNLTFSTGGGGGDVNTTVTGKIVTQKHIIHG